MASIQPIKPYQRAFIEKLGESIAATKDKELVKT